MLSLTVNSIMHISYRVGKHSKTEKNHHKTLKVIYSIDDSYYVNKCFILLCSNSVSIHQRYLRFSVTEILKSISQINPEFMWPFFKQKKLIYNLSNRPILSLPRNQSTYHHTNAVHLRGSLVQVNFPAEIKSSNSI